ncbi:MAG: hypothetical protein AB8G11_24165 [Saprospiraceae bacterium]
MNITQCFEILEQSDKVRFFGRRKSVDNKLLALKTLAEIGSPSLIESLFRYLKPASLRLETLQTIKVLFKKLKGKKDLYNSLKYCRISKQDIAYYKQFFDYHDFMFLMQIASLNHNGYIREIAIRYLGKSKNSMVLPFLIFRLGDWVVNVRNAAKEELQQFIQPKFHLELTHHLSLFQWLQKVQRTDLSSIYEQIIHFLIVEHRQTTLQFFKNIPEKERRILAQEFDKNLPLSSELQLFIDDKHFLIRLLAVKHFDKLSASQQEKLLNDTFGRIRYAALDCCVNHDNFHTLLIKYLADKSENVRYLSRYYLKESKIDFQQFYIDNLKNGNQLIGSLLGLLDIEAKNCEIHINPFLEHEKVSIAKTAFYVFTKLNPDGIYDFAKANLFSKHTGIRNIAIDYFTVNRTKEVLQMAHNQYDKANYGIKLSILKLFSRIGGFDVLPYLLMGTVNHNDNIRYQSIRYLQRWRPEPREYTDNRNETDKDNLRKVFNHVNRMHMKHSFFEKNPLKIVDFHIKYYLSDENYADFFIKYHYMK